MTNVKHTGWRGINFVFLKVKAVWDFETLRTSILLSFENRFGGFSTVRIFYFTRCLKLDFFHLAQSWMMGSKPRGPLRGRAFLRLAMSLQQDLLGELEMVVVY